ncbi:carbohydrate-binding protein [Hamadaea sp. NPDC051192]|uniref:carbohydrate-binding protein n=1 Tax=Hamadaea sp. NPDC051192 TaxID=3154940 RepID=UPI003424646B
MRRSPRLATGLSLTLISGMLTAISVAGPAAAAGAAVPFTSYEAEAGTLSGGATTVSLAAAPTTQYSSATLEASGHAYAHLGATGQGVQWTNATGGPISAINVRISIPDTTSGGGQTSTLNLYVDGTLRQTLAVNSKQTWLYEGNNNYNGNSQNPADGNPRVFFDETHALLTGTPIAAGSTVMLRKDASNSAAFYDVDVVDMENPSPLAQPANSISITDCGAVAGTAPTNGAADPAATDSRAAIQTCIDQAQSQGRTLWIPAGTFYVKGTQGLSATGITIAGAGMWYSTIYRDVPLPNSTPLPALWNLTSTTIRNLHNDSNATSRATVDGAGGTMDTTGTNWVADGIWTQHTLSGFWASGTGGTIRNCRLTTIWADGANINNVSLDNTVGNNLTITDNFVRGTGDDAIAINSVNYNDINGTRVYYTPMSNAVVTNNTSIAPWGGKGIGIYGGSGHRVENNYISDTARYIGLGAGRFGVNGNDLSTTTVSGNVVVRSGGNAYSQGQPAFHIGNGGDGQNVGLVDHVTAVNNTVLNSLYDGIGFSTSTNTVLQNNTVTSPGRNGIVVAAPFYPAPTGSATITGNTVTGASTAYLNNSGGFTAALSGNSWQGGGTPEAPFGGTPSAVPGVLQAENYNTGGQGVAYSVNSTNGTANAYRADGVDLEATSDTGGGYNLGWTSSGQWFHYTVNVATAGTYTVAARVAAQSAVAGAFHLANASNTNLSGAVAVPATGGWQTWATATAQVTLPAGTQTLTVYQDNGGWNLNSLTFTATTTSGPYGGTPAPVPGTVQAENYDTGGQGNGYNVTSTNGTSNAYRADGVDLEATSDTGGGYNVGWTSAGQWFKYTVNVATAGAYTLNLRVAAPSAVTGALHLANASGVNLTGAVSLPASGGWQTWTSASAQVTLPAGTQTLTLYQDAGGWNLNSLQFTAGGTSTNLAAGKPTSESAHNDVYASGNVTDCNQGSYWEGPNNAFPQWVQVDLGSAQSASRVVLQLPTSWGARDQTLTLQASTDGTTFTTVKTSAAYPFSPTSNNIVTLTFTATSQRYWRITVTANTGWPAAQLAEFQLWTT